jgi:aryl-alcohol dehydrogenase-like predicted oxidoreductase
MNFGGLTNEEDSAEIISEAISAGVNFLDTANVYNRGKSEEAVGKALKDNGKRDQIVLATKVHGVVDEGDPNGRGNSRRHIIQQCEASLKRLQTDYIDLYQMHRPMPGIPIDETLRALDDLIGAGKVRYIGTSCYASWHLVEALWVAKELGLNRFICEQPPYHLMDRRPERELVPMALTYGTAIIPWSPLVGGLLTGKYKRGSVYPEGSRFKAASNWADSVLNDKVFDALEAFEKIASDKDCTLSQFALAWCAAQPGITSPIIGPRTLEQLKDNLGAVKVEITEDDNNKIDKIIAPGKVMLPYYELDQTIPNFR